MEELLDKEREYAAMIFKDLMTLEGFVKQKGDHQDMIERNKLSILGEDASIKK